MSAGTGIKIIVIDDDPTGSQTVHSCPLLTRWTVPDVQTALADPAPLFFILSNTRALAPDQAAAVTQAICQNLRAALATRPQPVLWVSRSDSTLRGHYPLETDVMAAELGPFDAHFLIPAFFEGGRFTRDGIHYLKVNGIPTPVHQTEFARDSVFGYKNSYLPDYVAEKTQGRVLASQVQRLDLATLHSDRLESWLLALQHDACVTVDAVEQADLDALATALKRTAIQGKRWLLRSAASILTALAHLPPQPVPPPAMGRYTRHGAPGAILIGSHVPKTTAQLQRLLQEPRLAPWEIDISRLPQDSACVLAEAQAHATQAHAAGLTSVFYTSRQERSFADPNTRLNFGAQVSALLMDLVRTLPPTLGFLISKGGITSNDVLSTGLALPQMRLLGQILPGVSVVRCPPEHPRFPDLPVVIFPGNVGDDGALAESYRRMGPPSA